jgi:hypothetical protein
LDYITGVGMALSESIDFDVGTGHVQITALGKNNINMIVTGTNASTTTITGFDVTALLNMQKEINLLVNDINKIFTN